MRAVHFGAGNIGRGFIGAVLQDSGYFVTFADVNQELIDHLNKAKKYSLIELDVIEKRTTYKNFAVLNSSLQEAELVSEIASADIITASVGASILPFIAPVIAKGIAARTSDKPMVVMACENAINATDLLETKITELLGALPEGVYFANTAVDRIVPMQPAGSEPDVIAESFCEWVIDTSKLNGVELKIPTATMVNDLAPFIERKLYTVNTAQAAGTRPYGTGSTSVPPCVACCAPPARPALMRLALRLCLCTLSVYRQRCSRQVYS